LVMGSQATFNQLLDRELLTKYSLKGEESRAPLLSSPL